MHALGIGPGFFADDVMLFRLTLFGHESLELAVRIPLRLVSSLPAALEVLDRLDLVGGKGSRAGHPPQTRDAVAPRAIP